MISSNASDRIKVIQGDITEQVVDAIVNAANKSLLGGGGVDGAIHRAAGSQAKITRGYNLPAKWVIHTVGPVWQGGDRQEDRLLAACYRNSLALAQQYDVKTIAFPAISTGVYHFPLDRATKIAVSEVQQFLQADNSIDQALFVCFSEATYYCYLDTIAQM
jgi:O-acetyl-ADP-ribose deacetylase